MSAKAFLQIGKGLKRKSNSIRTVATAASWSFVSNPETATGSVPIQEYLPKNAQSLRRSSNSIHTATTASWSFVSSPETATGSVPIQEYLPEHVRSHLLSSQIVEKENTSQEQLKISKLHPTAIIGTAPGILSPETVAGSTLLQEFLDYPHLLLYHQSKKDVDPQPLPKTLQDALGNENDPRAIVVTEACAPFDIIDVNDAWVSMCGFSKEEARNSSLAMIQGPETNKGGIQAMISDLREGNETFAVIANYTKSGRKFHNYVRAGTLIDAQNHITHFVGVLQELSEPSDELHVAL